jgi:hypothetical protein
VGVSAVQCSPPVPLRAVARLWLLWQDRQSHHQFCPAQQIHLQLTTTTTYAHLVRQHNPIIQQYLQFNSTLFYPFNSRPIHSLLSVPPPFPFRPSDLPFYGQFFSSLIQQNGRAAAASACRDFIGERHDETERNLVHHTTFPSPHTSNGRRSV